MSKPTSIEIVRERLRKLVRDNELVQCESLDELNNALASVLADAERFKELERVHNGRSVYAMCKEHRDEKGRFTQYDVVTCPLADLADQLRKKT